METGVRMMVVVFPFRAIRRMMAGVLVMERVGVLFKSVVLVGMPQGSESESP